MADRPIAEANQALAWSHWSELGVPGTGKRSHDFQQIDLEALVWFTGTIDDARLQHEAMDWLASFGRYVALTRIKRLQRTDRSPYVDDMLWTVSATSKQIRWNVQGESLGFAPRGRARLDLQRRSLLQLRLRALLGVDAHADVLTVLLSAKVPLGTAELTDRAGFTKRSVAETLSSLLDAGFVERQQFRNRYLHSIDVERWRQLIGEPPSWQPWRDIYLFLSLAARLEQTFRGDTGLEAQIAWSKFGQQATKSLQRIALFSPRHLLPTTDLGWSHDSAAALAQYWASGLQ